MHYRLKYFRFQITKFVINNFVLIYVIIIKYLNIFIFFHLLSNY